MAKKEKEERKEVLALIKQSLYDGDWVNSNELQVLGEKTFVRDIVAVDFSGQCMNDLIGCLEDVFGVSLEDDKIKSSETLGDIVSVVVQQVSLA